MNRVAFVFADKPVARRDWLRNARRLRGVRGSKTRSFVALDASTGAVNLRDSSLRCDGVILWTARECGLLLPDCDLSAARPDEGQTLDNALHEFLKTNFVRVSKRAARRGDVLLMCDFDMGATAPHHLGVLTCASDAKRTILHCEAPRGFVVEVPCDALIWARVRSIWRLKAFAL